MTKCACSQRAGPDHLGCRPRYMHNLLPYQSTELPEDESNEAGADCCRDLKHSLGQSVVLSDHRSIQVDGNGSRIKENHAAIGFSDIIKIIKLLETGP